MTPGVLLPVAGLVASLLAGTVAIAYARSRGMLDQPGPRRSHDVPTPRGGGIAPVLVMLAGGAWLASRDAAQGTGLAACLAGFALVAGIGWIDDHRPLPASWRLLVHVVAALLAASALCGPPQGAAGVLSFAIATFTITSLVNAWNFMDGIDGLAVSQAVLALLAVLAGGWLAGTWMAFGWLAVAALVGFLPLNLPRARVFLGDAGSGAIGFVMAVVLLRAVASGALPWPLALLPVSAFLVDAGLTLGLRVLRGGRFWRPHREHLYQWLVRRGWTHGRVDLAYAGWTLAACTVALACAHSPAVAPAVTAAALLCGGLSWMGIRKRLWTMAGSRR